MPAGVSAYVPLANVTLGSNASTVTFSSISQSYGDLVLIIANAKEGTSNGASMLMRFNSVSSSSYTNVFMRSNGSTDTSGSGTDTAFYLSSGQGMSVTDPQQFVTNIIDYSATNKHKTVISRNDMPTGGTTASAQRFASTAAVSTITLLPFTGTIASGTSFALYGVSA